jgi:hypothetical protein
VVAVLTIATLSSVVDGAHRPFLEARYSPGLSDSCGWKARIDPDGTLTRFVEPTLPSGRCDTFAWPRPRLRRQAKPSRLSPAQLNRLRGALGANDLASVGFHPTPGTDCDGNPRIVSDRDTLELEITDATGTHQSGIYAWRDVLSSVDARCPNSIADDARRFLSVWVVVLDVVGSPNPGDNRDQFNDLLGKAP